MLTRRRFPQSRDVLNILESVYDANSDTTPHRAAGEPQTIGEMVVALGATQLAALTAFCTDWATTARHAAVAQAVLNAILRAYEYEELRAMIPRLKEV